jgi:catechol 2,3-dioxygenase-like lactoylglutathione lyase family enzyme
MHTIRSFQIKKMSPQLLVADIDRAIEFYTKKLGFDIDFRYEDFYAGIVKDGHSIHLKADKASVEERKNRRKHDDLEITFLVDDIESLYKDLSSKSVEFSQSLRDMPYGKEFYVADPDNNIISFLEV